MGAFKYQLATHNLFDYMGVERHLEKMAAKGWRFTSIGNFFWIYKKAEPASVKYSVTYIPEASQFDPHPLEKQRDMEAYCEAAGWKKVDNWMQMQIFCSENPDAVPIETDESLRLEVIHKTMKKNYLLSHILLLLVYALNAFTIVDGATYDWISFFSNNSRLWLCGVWLCGIILMAFDIGYYLYWYKSAVNAVQNGQTCPEPRLYRHFVRICIFAFVVLVLGLLSSYNKTMAISLLLYLTGIFLVIVAVRAIQQKMKWRGVSKGTNATVTVVSCIVLSLLLVGGTTWFSMVTWSRGETPSNVEFYDIGNRSWIIYSDPLPLYIEDFAQIESLKNSRHVLHEQESALLKKGQYRQTLYALEEEFKTVMELEYQIITVKAGFMYDSVLETLWKQKFRYAEEGEAEKTEYRAVYESEAGTMYQEYYEGLPVAYEWLVLNENKIIPLTVFLDELTEEQMEMIVEKLSK